MAIYSEEAARNIEPIMTPEETERIIIMEELYKIFEKFEGFTVADVFADHSPGLPQRGRLCHLIEEFDTDGCKVYVYDPSSHSSDEIDSYCIDWDDIDDNQTLDYILELAQIWAEQNEE